VESTRPGEFFPVVEEDGGAYIFNSKDLCMVEHVPALAASGITSFKIEGRAKTAYYTAVVTNAYRSAIDAFMNNSPAPDWAVQEVGCVSHRPYSTGFYFGDAEQSPEQSGYIRSCDFVGVIDGYAEGFVQLTQRNYFTADDCLEVIAPATPPERLVVGEMYNSKDERITVANHAVERLRIRSDREFVQGAMLRRVNKE
jgi:putative protease